MKTVSMLIKPASGNCNLRCRYCFYEDVSSHREDYSCGMMTEDTLEILVKQAIEHAVDCVSFAFQGGEPLLRGLPFFQTLIALEKKYRKESITIEHSIQTNGTLVNEEWAKFFHDHHFLVGLSLDGTKELHDLNRVAASGSGTWKTVTHALSILQKHRVETNLLCVVTGPLARKGQAVYQSLKKLGCRYLQFIPCLDPLGEKRGQQPFSLSPKRYEQFLKTVFDLWYRDWEQGDYVSIRLFDDYVHLLSGHPAGTCATNGSCGRYFVIEGDGSVYPCDFFVLDEWRMGNIREQSLPELAQSEQAVRFNSEGHRHPSECDGCQWNKLCNGGCHRDRIGLDKNYYCEALKDFFQYAMPRLEHLAALEKQLK